MTREEIAAETPTSIVPAVRDATVSRINPLDLVGTGETSETIEALRLQVEQLTAQNTAMRPIVLRVAEARMYRDAVTMIESCPHCSLKRGGDYGYSATHDETCVVSQARRLGF